MHNPTPRILDARLRHAAFALALEHFPPPISLAQTSIQGENPQPLTSSHDVALALLGLPHTLPKKQMVRRMRRRFAGFSQQIVYEWRYMCAQIIKALEDEQDSLTAVVASAPQPIDHIAQDPLTDSLQRSDVPDEPSRLPQIAPSPSPKLSSKTQENEYSSEANLTEDASSVEGPVKCQEKQTISGDSGDVDHHLSESSSQSALDPFTQCIISSSLVAVVEHPKSQSDIVLPVPLSSTASPASKQAPVMGAAQVAALNAVSTSNGPAAVLPSSLVTLSTSSLGAAESPVPCTLGKRDLVAADEPVEGSSSASEEGGPRLSKLSKLGFWNVFSSFR